MKRRHFLLLTGVGGTAVAFDGLLTGISASNGAAPETKPGIESVKMTTCLMCPGGCGLRVRSVDGDPSGISGNPNHPINAGGVCTEGIAALQLLYHPDRILQPMRRKNGDRTKEFEAVSWDEALKAISAAINESVASREKIGFLLGRSGGTMEQLVRHFMATLGARNLFLDGVRDGYQELFQVMHGINARPAFDFDSAEMVLSFGADLLNAWESPLQFQRSYAARGAMRGPARRLVMVDIRYSRTAAEADEFVGVAPGSHGALALGLAYVILRENLYDAKFAEERLYGFNDLDAARPGYRSTVLRDYSPEMVSRLTGVPVERILALGKAFGESASAIALFDENVAATPGGLFSAMAVHSLNLLKGNINRPGGIFLQPKTPLQPLGSTPAGPLPGIEHLAQQRDADPLSLVFLYCSNPLYSSPHRKQIAERLQQARLVVSFSPLADETSPYVDYLLPDAMFLERWDDRLFPATSAVPGWGIVQPCVPPAGQARPAGDVLLEIARRAGGSLAQSIPWKDFREVLQHRARALYEAQSGTLCTDVLQQDLVREMESRGWWMPTYQNFDEFWQQLLQTGAWTDPNHQVGSIYDYSGHADGRIDLYSRELAGRRALASSGSDEIECLPHFHSSEAPKVEYVFTLNPYRPGKFGGGTHALLPWAMQGAGILERAELGAWAEINPADAKSHGIADRDWIWVEGAGGKLRLRALLDPGTAPGVVNIPYGLGHTHSRRWGAGVGVNPMELIAPEMDPVSGLSNRYGAHVKISKA
jgi:anaerobic selenocysteine-containing dehydrogenase